MPGPGVHGGGGFSPRLFRRASRARAGARIGPREAAPPVWTTAGPPRGGVKEKTIPGPTGITRSLLIPRVGTGAAPVYIRYTEQMPRM